MAWMKRKRFRGTLESCLPRPGLRPSLQVIERYLFTYLPTDWLRLLFFATACSGSYTQAASMSIELYELE